MNTILWNLILENYSVLTKVWQYQLFNASKVFFLVHYIPKPKLTFYHSSLNMQNKWTEFRSESRDERNGIKLSNRILPQVFLKRFKIFFLFTWRAILQRTIFFYAREINYLYAIMIFSLTRTNFLWWLLHDTLKTFTR